MLSRIFPFLTWFRGYSRVDFRADAVAGLTVALVLIPQSMAYAQLAGLPAYYGLYAAFLPPLIASLFGSSRQLATGPVAVVSLMTATALEPLATAGSEAFILYAILLALLVGIFQFLLGLLRLGLVVNFLSHPVVNGFTSAAALIIATSQLSKIFGVSVDKGVHHYETVYNVVAAAIAYIHWPTLGLALLAFAIMIATKRLNPKLPGVLIAVIVTTGISWGIGFHNDRTVAIESIGSDEVTGALVDYGDLAGRLAAESEERIRLNAALTEATDRGGPNSAEALRLHHEISLANIEISELKEQAIESRRILREFQLTGIRLSDDRQTYVLTDEVPSGFATDDHVWRLKVGQNGVNRQAIVLIGGGAVVGTIPAGLPSPK
ncbi:MAG: sodium-independent anion transporter, partial [candidate division Zixibacteria bacterium]|nr:sodium-independent anion transporter [candidate division Zixibacteria bacterium]